jgi:carboxypeptidase Q
MRLAILLAPALLLAALACPAEEAKTTTIPPAAAAVAETLRDRALQQDTAWDIVESLTTEVGQRLAGTEGDARAVAWAVAKFRALGFDEVRTEPVTFPVWLRGEESGEVLSPFPQPLVLTALGGSIGTEGAPLDAEIVHFETLDALRAVPDDSLDGRIAFISTRTQRYRDGRGYGLSVGSRVDGASIAAAKGASALLIRSIGTSNDRFPHTGNMRYAEGGRRIPAAAVSNPDADLLLNMLRREQPVTVRIRMQAATVGEYTSQNVIGEVRGSELPDEVVLIGGHLDSWDLGTGAIDDGAGVAITMAAGALIASLPERPRRSIRVVAFANEEQGLIGARQYAERHAASIRQHLIGAESDFGAGRIYGLRSNAPDQAWPAIEQIGAVLAPLGIELERGVGGPGPDLIPLVARGMTWAQLAQDGTDYFDYHHTPNDTLDKIDPIALRQQVAAYAAFAWMAAQAEGDFGAEPKGL